MSTTPATQPLGALIGNHLMQLSYVCPDLDRAASSFSDRFGVPGFMPLGELTFDRDRARLALGFSGKLFYELIQPLTEGGLFAPCLEGRRDPVAVLHHVGLKVDDFDRASADVRAAGYDYAFLDEGELFRYGFVDTTAALGHMLEVMWTGPEGEQILDRVKRGDF